MTERVVRLVAAGPPAPDDELLSWLGAALRERLGVAPASGDPLALRDHWRRMPGGQVSSNELVDALIARDEAVGPLPPDPWALAVTDADLFAEDRDFVFGEAALGGAWAVVSTARLRDDAEPHLLRDRLLKEALHELGHVAGLRHCGAADCVMSPSPRAEDIDRKSDRFCSHCLPGLRERGLRPP